MGASPLVTEENPRRGSTLIARGVLPENASFFLRDEAQKNPASLSGEAGHADFIVGQINQMALLTL